MAHHRIQATLDESTGGVTARHFVTNEIETADEKIEVATHHEDKPLPDDLAAELKAVLAKVLDHDRKDVARRAKGHARRHEFFAHTLPAEIATGKVVRDERGKILGKIPIDPKE